MRRKPTSIEHVNDPKLKLRIGCGSSVENRCVCSRYQFIYEIVRGPLRSFIIVTTWARLWSVEVINQPAMTVVQRKTVFALLFCSKWFVVVEAHFGSGLTCASTMINGIAAKPFWMNVQKCLQFNERWTELEQPFFICLPSVCSRMEHEQGWSGSGNKTPPISFFIILLRCCR